MKSIALGGLLSFSALANPSITSEGPTAATTGSRLRLFLGGTVEAGGGSTDRKDVSLSNGGLGLAVDLGSQINDRWAIYLALRGSTSVFATQGLGMLMVELSPIAHFSIATGAGGIGIFWLGAEASHRELFGLAIPIRLSWDLFEVTPARRVGVRLSLEGGIAPVGEASGNRGCSHCGYELPVMWAGLLVGAVWR